MCMDYFGRLVLRLKVWPPAFPALCLGSHTIEARRRLIWDGSDVLAEVPWDAARGQYVGAHQGSAVQRTDRTGNRRAEGTALGYFGCAKSAKDSVVY